MPTTLEMVLTYKYENLKNENKILQERIKYLEEKNEEILKELNRRERMTEDENRAYWGTYG